MVVVLLLSGISDAAHLSSQTSDTADLFPGVIPSVGFELRNPLFCFLCLLLQNSFLSVQTLRKLWLLNAQADNTYIWMTGSKVILTTETLPLQTYVSFFRGI